MPSLVDRLSGRILGGYLLLCSVYQAATILSDRSLSICPRVGLLFVDGLVGQGLMINWCSVAWLFTLALGLLLVRKSGVGGAQNAGSIRSIKPRLRAADELTVSDLLHLALMKSINSAAVALAEQTAGS